MHYPLLNTIETNREMIDIFKGYNHNLRIGDGEFYDMKNMSSDCYPVLAPRRRRGVYASPDAPNGIIAKEKLCYVDGSEFVIGEDRISMGLSYEPKQLVSMGAYVVIMPDKKYINTMDLEDRGDIEWSKTYMWDAPGSPIDVGPCTVDGGQAEEIKYISGSVPASPANGEIWFDTSESLLKRYSEESGLWVELPSSYVGLWLQGIDQHVKVGDAVEISGFINIEDDINDFESLNGSKVVVAVGENYIVFAGTLSDITAVESDITISRSMPDMDYVIESGNRLWGCRYGLNADGEFVNEIYASKLGDFKNWNCFAGVSTDSYAASCGTDGPFTGAVTYMGYPLFFKENCFHKVFGSYPANFQIQSTECRGVQEGCSRSLAIANEKLYYKARGAVCEYDGSLPTEVSYELGNVQYANAVAGGFGNKYYISMDEVSSGERKLFVYDTQKGLWHKEDDFNASCFCAYKDELYAIDDADQIVTMLGSGTQDSDDIEWMVESGEIGITTPDMKYITRLLVRMRIDVGAEVRIYAAYDYSEEWELLYTLVGSNLRSFSVPVRPRRCDWMKLRIEGTGEARIYSITKTIAQGSDRS